MNGVSSILINYVQIKRMKGSPQIIERPLWVKRTLLKLTNEIQLAVGKENRAFRIGGHTAQKCKPSIKGGITTSQE